MFYVKTMFNELVNLEHARMIYMHGKITSNQFDVWAVMPERGMRLHAGTKEQCEKFMEEVFLRMRMHNHGDAFGVMAPGKDEDDERTE